MMDNLMKFENDEFGQLRGILINNKPYFIGKEITEVLGYVNSKDAIQKHIDDEDKQIIQRSQFATLEIPNRGLTVINESGLYSLILSSKLANAKKFKRWVTSEVLPTIRKNGMYAADELLDNPDLLIAAATRLKEERAARLKAEQKIIEQQNQLNYKDDVIVGLVDEISLAEKRQILNRVVRYKHADYRERWSELYKQFQMKYHIDLKQRFENYNSTHKPKMKSKVEYIEKVMNKLPELYEIACKLYESDIKELTQELYEIAN